MSNNTRAVTEFTVTYFGLSGLESDALLDLYVDHARRYAQWRGHERPGVRSKSWPTVDAWDTDDGMGEPDMPMFAWHPLVAKIVDVMCAADPENGSGVIGIHDHSHDPAKEECYWAYNVGPQIAGLLRDHDGMGEP